MNTVGYLLILVGALVLRQAMKGRSVTDLPGDLGGLLTALIAGDMDTVSSVLARTGTATAPVAQSGFTQTANTAPVTGSGDGVAVLAEAKRLGSNARYVLGATGPTSYDCSGLVWRAMVNTGAYSGGRFTTATFVQSLGNRIARVSSPVAGDIVLWSGHIGIAESSTSCYSARNPRSGIGSSSISAFKGTPTYWRLAAAKTVSV